MFCKGITTFYTACLLEAGRRRVLFLFQGTLWVCAGSFLRPVEALIKVQKHHHDLIPCLNIVTINFKRRVLIKSFESSIVGSVWMRSCTARAMDTHKSQVWIRYAQISSLTRRNVVGVQLLWFHDHRWKYFEKNFGAKLEIFSSEYTKTWRKLRKSFSYASFCSHNA
jgi:hypothetical protein